VALPVGLLRLLIRQHHHTMTRENNSSLQWGHLNDTIPSTWNETENTNSAAAPAAAAASTTGSSSLLFGKPSNGSVLFGKSSSLIFPTGVETGSVVVGRGTSIGSIGRASSTASSSGGNGNGNGNGNGGNNSIGGGGGGGGGSGSDVRTTMTMAYHWAAVIPWMLSVLFGFVIPIFLYIMSCIRSRRLQQMRESDYAAYRIRRRRDRLKSYFVNVTKVCCCCCYCYCYCLHFACIAIWNAGGCDTVIGMTNKGPTVTFLLLQFSLSNVA